MNVSRSVFVCVFKWTCLGPFLVKMNTKLCERGDQRLCDLYRVRASYVKTARL